MKNIQNKNPVGKRVELVEKFGYDTKFAYHVVRLVNECECILLKEDLDIEEDNSHSILCLKRQNNHSIDLVDL